MFLSAYIIDSCRDIADAISAYFQQGHTYRFILQFLRVYHNTDMSLSTLKRRIIGLQLSRYRIPPSDRNELLTCLREIQEETGK